MTRLVYIGGYGRSGSTLLEVLLSASPALLACGEIASSLRTPTTAKQKCSCGRRRGHCPVWSRVDELERRDSRHIALTLALLDTAAKDYAVMVDCSKTAWGAFSAPFRLRRALRRQFDLVHMVRDPRAVCWSAIAKSRRRRETLSNPLLRCLRTSIGWWFANLSCEIFGWLHPTQYRRIRYEDLARDPQTMVTALLAEIAPDLDWSLEQAGKTDNRHQLAGNRMRRRHLSLANISEDSVWKWQMPTGYGRLAAALAWPWRRKYGYA